MSADVFRVPPGRHGRHRRRTALTYAAIMVGGMVGGTARWALGEAFPRPTDGFPWVTFGINVSGAFALAVFLVLVQEVWRPGPYLRPLVATGVIGAFTTWSTFVDEVDVLATGGRVWHAAGYAAASTLVGLAAAALGLLLGRRAAATRGSTTDRRTT